MPRFFLPFVAGLTLLTACDGTNPFMVATAPDGTTEQLEPGDPNTDINSRFLWNPDRSFTMNSVVFDEANNQLVINNLPFDGPAGRYDNVATMANGAGIYRSRTTPTTGQIRHYAVFLRSDYMDAAAAAGVNWNSYGNQGANVNRTDFDLPAQGEYVYVGDYAGMRTFDQRSGMELTSGDLHLILDILDFDPADGIQGDITGFIDNHHRVDFNGNPGRDLPTVVLSEVQFTTNQGVFEGGTAATFDQNGDPWSTGQWEGLLAGVPGDQEIGGYIAIEGVADIQEVSYQTISWTLTQVDPFGFTVITTGTSSGLSLIDSEAYQDAINAGATLPTYIAAPPIPTGAVATGTAVGTLVFQTDYKAQEIGVFLGDCVAPCDGVN